MKYYSYHDSFKDLLDEEARKIFLKKRMELVDK
ncbi:hypothetical protein IE9_05515 [Bacillus cereus BAG4X12-1]|nr:hypothetical protein IE9_05515 [Bacillus cereus BAG4X12-1]EOP77769.1 hypothetical protein IEG_05557 [Bacillus cereus BAG5X12-1]